MAASGLPIERLQEYLQQLPPAAQALLIKKLESDGQEGEPIPGGELLLQELRNVLRQSNAPAPSSDSAEKHFFRPVDLFVSDDDPAHKLKSRIARTSLTPLWTWICRDLLPNEAKAYTADMARALAAVDSVACERLTQTFQDVAVADIRSMIAAVQADLRARRRLVGQIGTPNALDDITNLATILFGRATFTLIASRLPGQIRNFADSQIEGVKGLLDGAIGKQVALLPNALVLVLQRLAAPWQLIRLAVKAADSDDASRIVATPYGAAVTIVFAEIDRMVVALGTDLRRGPGPAVSAHIKSIHDAIRGVRTELAFAADSPYGRKLAAIRAEISGALQSEIDSTSGRVRRLLRPNLGSEVLRNGVLDPGEVSETEALIEFVGVCRNHASELAVSEMTLRTHNEVQQYLDTTTQVLLDAVRGADAANRSLRQSQLDAAVRFSAKAFGKGYAALLAKAAEVAANSERKAAARA